MRALGEGSRRRFERDSSALVWLVHVLQPLLILSVVRGIGLAMSERPQLDLLGLQRVLDGLLDSPPGAEP